MAKFHVQLYYRHDHESLIYGGAGKEERVTDNIVETALEYDDEAQCAEAIKQDIVSSGFFQFRDGNGLTCVSGATMRYFIIQPTRGDR